MQDPASEDSDLIDDILLSLENEDNMIRVELPPKRQTTNNLKEETNLVNEECNTYTIELVIEDSEVQMADGLSIEDLLGREIEVIDEVTEIKETHPEAEGKVTEVLNTTPGLCDSDNGDLLKKIGPDFPIDDPSKDNSNIVPVVSDNEERIEDHEMDAAEDAFTDDEQIDGAENHINLNGTVPKNGPRKRNKKPKPSDWEINHTKRLRMTGKRFTGFERKKVDGKIVVSRTTTEREERKLGPRCDSVVCNANKKRHCREFSDDDRNKHFEEFWALSWEEKEIYVRSNIIVTKPKKRTGVTPSRRSGTLIYSLKHEGSHKQMCKKFFLNTLGIKEWMAHNWAKRSETLSVEETPIVEAATPSNNDEDINQASLKGKISHKRQYVEEWLEKLPKLPSHYCRKDSSKLYLEPVWESKIAMYREYQRDAVEQGHPWASMPMFVNIFEEMNLSIFSPRKDQCDTCCAYKVGNVSKDNWDKHIIEKDRARKEKETDKKLGEDGKIYCLCADLEAVKVTPMTKASAMYYKTKLCSHNYTVYNLANHHCTCYWFNETEGDLSANTFASCLTHYLKKHCLAPRLPIVIYSDGCTNQNRNQFLSNALLHLAMESGVEITQKFLIKGPTQMEGDSVHALIERKLKNKDVYVPYEYVKYTKEARRSPFPYEVEYLRYDFFCDYSKLGYYDSIRPGCVKGDPVVVDIHCLNHHPSGKIQYKLSFDDAYKDLPRRPQNTNKKLTPPQLYTGRLPVPESKWKHLQELKSVIPADFHEFYDNLPH